MIEMQSVRTIHCKIWTDGVREIVSAEGSAVKFITTDHPVTVYNRAFVPSIKGSIAETDPDVALRGSQTIFPLNRDFCLILSNLEHARDPQTNPRMARTFARNYSYSLVRSDAMIRSRRLSELEVQQINFIMKSCASKYIAAGNKDWLFPETGFSGSWSDLGKVLTPPKNELYHFGGEVFAKFDSGHVHYQDEFGRTEKEREFLKKQQPERMGPGYACGCGSGRTFKKCCYNKPTHLRATWAEQSIRERNVMLFNAITNILELADGKDWVTVRKELTDEKISKIYLCYEGLWPLETDLLSLLPKPDGIGRAVYTGHIHPSAIQEIAMGSSPYFGEVIIAHPFLHAGSVRKEFNPVENPKQYRQEFLKSVMFFLTIFPLVDVGIVNLVPDPGDFDIYFRDQTMGMARSRSKARAIDINDDPSIKKLAMVDLRRGMLSFPDEFLLKTFKKTLPELEGLDDEQYLSTLKYMRESDPLAVLQDGSFGVGASQGQISNMKLMPNFESSMYLAQATGSCIVTDNKYRWNEICEAISNKARGHSKPLGALKLFIETSKFAIFRNVEDIATSGYQGMFSGYAGRIWKAGDYLRKIKSTGIKENFEKHIAGQFAEEHAAVQRLIGKSGVPTQACTLTCAFPADGIQDNTISRLLLMSNSKHHTPSVPIAFLLSKATLPGLA